MFTKLDPYKDHTDSTLGVILAYSLSLFFLAALMIKLDATSDKKSDQVRCLLYRAYVRKISHLNAWRNFSLTSIVSRDVTRMFSGVS